MKECERKPGQWSFGTCLLMLVSSVLIFSSALSPVSGNNQVEAVPDYGRDDCVSFKYGLDTNPLNFTFGYACVSENYCEVSAHGCIDETCHYMDYSRGARTALIDISIATQIDKVIMGPTGENLSSSAQWCLVRDGAGNFWALDKGNTEPEPFSLQNQHETIIPCETTDYFRSDLGCVADIALR